MGREVRRVSANWQHPKNGDRYKPLYGRSYSGAVAKWDEHNAKWNEGLRDDWNGGWKPLDGEEEAETYADWDGDRPVEADYMPDWPEAERTHYQMYEDTTEGTPISPVCETPEELARWLADNNASAFAGQCASYESWLRVCRGGYAPSAVMDAKGLRSGVEALSD
jgi:hypothetical protein